MIDTPSRSKPYSKGPYNKSNDKEQWIRITEGCPNACKYCRESVENGVNPIYHPIPDIVRNKVTIIDMNLTAKPRALEIIQELGKRKVNNKVVHYDLNCGIDYRYLTQDMANALKQSRFIKPRIAWDYGFSLQKQIRQAVLYLLKAGYRPKQITCYILCNYKTPYTDCLMKLDLLKVWNVKAADCWFDNQLPPHVKPLWWSIDHIKMFRKKVRKHNQLINWKIDPEYGKITTNFK